MTTETWCNPNVPVADRLASAIAEIRRLRAMEGRALRVRDLTSDGLVREEVRHILGEA